MSSVSQPFRLHVLDLLAPLGPIAEKRMFSGIALIANGGMFAMMLNETLYLRADDASRPRFEAAGCRPFGYSRAGKWVESRNYYAAPDETLEDRDAMLDWARGALAAVKPPKARSTRHKAANPRAANPRAANPKAANPKAARPRARKPATAPAGSRPPR